ncbi:MAG TPA: preprotein translocase subunit Sec61beta [Candidatus Acidoferrum sp.]|nr:preprotein translocase subunit Sec61beta [Candidatus Acidoferrum sp.]
MALLQSPQQSAGVMSFYDAPTKGPKVNPKIILIIVAAFAIIILVANHFLYI